MRVYILCCCHIRRRNEVTISAVFSEVHVPPVVDKLLYSFFGPPVMVFVKFSVGNGRDHSHQCIVLALQARDGTCLGSYWTFSLRDATSLTLFPVDLSLSPEALKSDSSLTLWTSGSHGLGSTLTDPMAQIIFLPAEETVRKVKGDDPTWLLWLLYTRVGKRRSSCCLWRGLGFHFHCSLQSRIEARCTVSGWLMILQVRSWSPGLDLTMAPHLSC